MGPFVRRLIALTFVWLLATAAITYAASRRIASPPTATPPTTTTTTTVAGPATIAVPDVRNQAYVFAEGVLSDAGFSWHVTGPVQGYAADTVVTQSPKPGTQVVNTGSPTITLTLAKAKGVKEAGVPENTSPTVGTKLELPSALHAATKPTAATTTTSTTTTRLTAKKTPAKAPAHRWPQHRPPAFVVPGARKEPLDEMPLTNRAQLLLNWIEKNPKPTDANVRYWLYQNAWIVDGAREGWWQGAEALDTLIAVDHKAMALWGIGDKSAALAQSALAYTEARAK
ncbi:MAG TPA: PASTA domain-containing protein [Gaiellaceae bacterium]|nr:PASTA domain-containing protein [Gaiellaceae bacterium]